MKANFKYIYTINFGCIQTENMNSYKAALFDRIIF